MAKEKFIPPDKTADEIKEASKQRQQKRKEQIDTLVKAAGWSSVAALLTAFKNGDVPIPQNPEKKQS